MTSSSPCDAIVTSSLRRDVNSTLSPVDGAGDDWQLSGGHVCGLFFFVVYGPCFGVVCGLGLVGNALSFGVLHRYSRDNVATYLLKSLALADNLLLLTGGTVQIGMGMAIYFGYRTQLYAIYPYLQTYAWPAVQITQLLSVWMTVLVAANRYVAVCRPLHAPQLCTKRRVRIQIAVMAILVFLASTPRFFEHAVEVRVIRVPRDPCLSGDAAVEAVTQIETVPVGLTTELLYNILYENIFYCLFVFFLPLVVLVFFNVHLVSVLKRAKRHWSSARGLAYVSALKRPVGPAGGGGGTPSHQKLNHQDPEQGSLGRLGSLLIRTRNRSTGAGTEATGGAGGGAGRGARGRSGEENNITLVMAIIVLTFIACETPATINQFMFYALQDDFDIRCSPYQRFFHVCNLLVVINSSMNFVIYCLFRRQFRRQLRDLLCCRTRQPIRASASMIAANGGQPSTTSAGGLTSFARTSVLHTAAVGRHMDGSIGGASRGGGYRRGEDSFTLRESFSEVVPLRHNNGSNGVTDYPRTCCTVVGNSANCDRTRIPSSGDTDS